MMDKPDKEKLPTLAEVADALKLWDDPCLRRRPRYGTAVQQAIDDLSDGVPVLWCPCGRGLPWTWALLLRRNGRLRSTCGWPRGGE